MARRSRRGRIDLTKLSILFIILFICSIGFKRTMIIVLAVASLIFGGKFLYKYFDIKSKRSNYENTDYFIQTKNDYDIVVRDSGLLGEYNTFANLTELDLNDFCLIHIFAKKTVKLLK